MESFKIVAFKLGDEEYGLDIKNVQSIERIQQITRVPNAPHYVKGVINLRGTVTPVIDLRAKLDFDQSDYTNHTRVIITKYNEIQLGFIVDRTSDVIDAAYENMENTSSISGNTEFFEGIAKINGRLIILLNLEELVKTSNN
ncbi:chemotaxis protein CheW [Neobacillus sp. YX16]|uniref:chemotaxis protein CheW n=1 Tax=Neobacillus sp. YX16 TaxID=3047874 RepID=UPI0024C21FCD|nr:chemotaxis protein CheW [Neobacillus sp. YX16]WHZ05390.1 chemotaxis protein CheW [Neobacillus sp. YX16]